MIVSNVTYQQQESLNLESGAQIGQEAFLTLLLAQLSHQDPLSPMDSMEFTAQLSQFSQLEQMVGVNEKLDSLLLYQSSLNSWQGVGMIDREVDALGDWVNLTEGVAGMIGYSLDEDCSRVIVQIFDTRGNLVRTLDAGSRQKGNHLIDWDGRNENGNTLPDGRYTVTVTVESDKGPDPVTTFVRGRVTGVSFNQGIPLLLMGNETIAFANVLEVRGISED
jgi:flagellar basal-body rod modification protein FlgD